MGSWCSASDYRPMTTTDGLSNKDAIVLGQIAHSQEAKGNMDTTNQATQGSKIYIMVLG